MKYHIEIDTNGAEYEDGSGRFVSYGLIIAEGDTLEECLDNASVDLVDQDGGEAGMHMAEENWMQDAIREAFMKKYTHAGKLLPGSY